MTQELLQQYAFEESVLLGWEASPDLRLLHLQAEVMRTFLHPKLAGKHPKTVRRADLYVVVDVEFYGVTFCRYCVSSAISSSGSEEDYGGIDAFEEVLHSELLGQLQLPGDTIPGTALHCPTATSPTLRHFLCKSDYLDLEVVCEGVRLVERRNAKGWSSPKKGRHRAKP
ncbi:MAG TPA: hypothetical protein VIH59_34525 [Candidatus Tectomicrobia bacterium]